MSTKNNLKRGKKKVYKKRRIIFYSITLLILFVISICAGYYIYLRNKIYVKNQNVESNIMENQNYNKDDYEEETNYKEIEGITNVLLVGTDGRSLDEKSRADSIIIATLDNNNKEVRLTSLFRDTLVNINGYGPQKLNAAMAFGGIDLLKDTIKKTYNINIDKYVIINFWGFENIIDQIGGIKLDIKDYQIKELNKYIGDSTGGNNCPIEKPGLQLLNGKQALSYARIRKGVGDEFERTERQREVLFKVAEKLRETKPIKYFGILNSMLDDISTNIEPLDALNMAYTIYKFPDLQTKQIHIPLTELSDDMNYSKEIGWVFIMDREQNTKVLHDFIFNDIEPNKSNFDYDSLREALLKYKTDEWQNEYEDTFKNITNKDYDNENDI